SSILFRLDRFEKQLEKRKVLLKQKKNNIKNTIDIQVGEKRKCLKDEYDALKDHLKADDLKKQYKSRIYTLEKVMIEKDREIDKLSTNISQTKKNKNALKKDLISTKKTIKILFILRIGQL
ncbi:5913_t:CDS:2, partial [Funneliformis geosporum]